MLIAEANVETKRSSRYLVAFPGVLTLRAEAPDEDALRQEGHAHD
jgi:hypothetical protein